MARTQQSLDDNLSKLTTTKVRKTRSDKKPEFIKTKSDTKFTSGTGFPWYLHPVKKDHFNKSWFRDYDDACKQIARLRLQPKDYTLWNYVK
jgi:peptide methionine sulfoxide reductase MsrB